MAKNSKCEVCSTSRKSPAVSFCKKCTQEHPDFNKAKQAVLAMPSPNLRFSLTTNNLRKADFTFAANKYVIDKDLVRAVSCYRLAKAEAIHKPRAAQPKPAQPKYTAKQIESFKEMALELYEADESHAKELGDALLQVKAALRGAGKGAFEKWWKDEHKLSQARVSYCMRLAQGKVAAAKIKLKRSPERIAASNIKKRVDGFLKFFANEKHCKTVDQLHTSLGNLILFMVDGCSKMRHWPLVGADDPKGNAAKEILGRALREFLDAAFVPDTFEDMEQVTRDAFGSPGPASAYMPKKKPAAESAKAAATA